MAQTPRRVLRLELPRSGRKFKELKGLGTLNILSTVMYIGKSKFVMGFGASNLRDILYNYK